MENRSKYCMGILSIMMFISVPVKSQKIIFKDHSELFMPSLVSTPNADVKMSFSPDNKKMLWGGIGWIKGKEDMDIWQSSYVDGHWTTPKTATFNSDFNDFDPFFSPDGKGVYFFSNRPEGFGGDDIYFASYNATTDAFDPPVNMGDKINTSGNEWAPVTDAKAKNLFFSSNGHSGFGGQDLFTVELPLRNSSKVVNLGSKVNGPEDDFDAVLLPDNHTLIFTSLVGKNKKAALFVSYKNKNSFGVPTPLPSQINAEEFWTFGPSVNFNEAGYLYFSSHLPESPGRTDIYRIGYKFDQKK